MGTKDKFWGKVERRMEVVFEMKYYIPTRKYSGLSVQIMNIDIEIRKIKSYDELN